MTSSKAEVEVELSLGGTQTYTVDFVRTANHIGWAVASIDIDFSGSNTVSTSDDSDEGAADEAPADSTAEETAETDGSAA